MLLAKEIRISNSDEIEPIDSDVRPIKLTWVKDTKGQQGEVLFDGKLYWLTRIDEKSGKAYNVPLTIQEWNDRNNEMTERSKTNKR